MGARAWLVFLDFFQDRTRSCRVVKLGRYFSCSSILRRQKSWAACFVIPSDSRIWAHFGPDTATSFGVNDPEDCIAGAYRRTGVRAR